MNTVQPQGEQVRKAIKHIAEIRKNDPDVDLVKLVDETALQFDLSPKDSEFLSRFVQEES
ncbi:MAG: hypothetical protein MI892_15820 [Desulfobacterales bacterium]|nr:hypothetical protein [Desulfobacterales bacterium]